MNAITLMHVFIIKRYIFSIYFQMVISNDKVNLQANCLIYQNKCASVLEIRRNDNVRVLLNPEQIRRNSGENCWPSGVASQHRIVGE